MINIKFASFFLLSLFSLTVFSASDRIALVIGNSKYSELGTLPNTINDAKAISKSLTDMGYKTKFLMDAKESDLRRALKAFANESDVASIAVVYYAGHGAQVNSENYLLPVDIDIPKRESDIQLSALKVDDIINSLRSKTKVIFLDACRDNPALIKSLSKGRGSYRGGLAPASNTTLTDQSSGIFIAYATDAGNVALDGSGQVNSPFTTALLKYIKEPISIDDMFSMVTKEVRRETKNQQKPYKYASLDGIVCLPGSCVKAQPDIPVTLKDNVNDHKSKEFSTLSSDWILFASGASPNTLVYMKPSSIRRQKDRVFFDTKFVYESTPNFLSSNASSTITSFAMSCSTHFGNVFQAIEFDESGNKIKDIQFGAPEVIDLKVDYTNQQSISYLAIKLACEPDLFIPLVSATEFKSDQWKRYYTIKDGVDFSLLQGAIAGGKEIDVINKVTFKPTQISQLKEYINVEAGYQDLKNTPIVSALITKHRFNCLDNTNIEYLDHYLNEDGKLIAIAGYIKPHNIHKNLSGTPFDQLSKLICLETQ